MANKFSRAPLDQRDRDRRIKELWAQGHPIIDMAIALGYTHSTSVSHAAKRLGLPKRAGNRFTVKATQARTIRLRLRQREREAPRPIIQESPIPGIEPPTCWVCGGASQGWDGHDACRGRRPQQKEAA